MTLFDMEPDPAAVAALERAAKEKAELADLSPDRRRTLRQRRDVEAGVHPLMKSATRPDLGTCGGCVHRVLVGRGNGTYPKCDLSTMSHGASSDVRAWWPACGRFAPASPVDPG